MRIEAIATSVDGPHSAVLEPTSATIETGAVTIVDGPPGTGHTAFSLLLGGRLVPSSGRVLIDGEADGQRLRDVVALVDVPDVSEPDDVVSLATTMGEELAMARRPAGRGDVKDWLDERGAAQWRRTRVEDVPADVRLALLADVAARRPGVEALVLCCPDRYGADPHAALGVAHELADRGLAVCLQLTTNSLRNVRASHTTLGAVR
ncbi:hypothetical protein IDH50_02655 [Aeromicrobium tamlense]|uniref:Energy-coupling factor transporter ATP-binding protein EcfA2 n=1 Tax=Aeromicrobium tamlense TaxID=375541 RepID=A0A8I0KKP8_9ACTN|nr:MULTISPECIES: hypothetical protein [Aeromicrobium]MBD1269123.1 hypothetical protein [Aeromicrobium tamlense]NYI36968.1 energy-coupling factor transporter ATP-binding protein EcfA2 [Aeromicrobium tamlense]